MKEQFDLESIGFKKSFMGDTMNYYKLKRNGKEYLIIHVTNMRLINLIWSEENTFKDTTDLWDDFERPITVIEKDIKKSVKNCNKKNYILGENEENNFFTPHIIIPKKRYKKPKREIGNLSSEDVNLLISIIINNIESEKFLILTNEIIGKHFKELINYQINYITDGYHKNDGHLVKYSFTLKSPKGEITTFSTEMCLMVGWNYSGILIIN